MTLFFTYITRNKINGKQYFGIHKTNYLKDGYIGSGTRLSAAIKKHGRQNFEIIERVFYEDYASLLLAEARFVTTCIVEDANWYNLKLGGIGGEWNDDVKKKISDTLVAKNKERTQEEIEKNSIKMKKVWQSLSDEQKVSHARKSQSWHNKTQAEKDAINEKRDAKRKSKTAEQLLEISIKKRKAMISKTEEEKLAMAEKKRQAMSSKTPVEKMAILVKRKCTNALRTEAEILAISKKKKQTVAGKTDEEKKIISQKISERLLGMPKPKIQCPFCGLIGGTPVMKRYHFNNCKSKL